jgi:hypothetical protein
VLVAVRDGQPTAIPSAGGGRDVGGADASMTASAKGVRRAKRGTPLTRAERAALAATLHDPLGGALPLLDDAVVGAALSSYRRVVVAATGATDSRVIARLTQCGIDVVPGGQTGEGRRAALAAAPAGETVFSCDFDRWLHWARHWPAELATLPERVARLGHGDARPWYVCLGRTARAFRTHPPSQRLPEEATNRALSLAAGRPLDAVAGAAWLFPEAVRIVLGASREPTAATDLEWPALILRADRTRLRGLRCEGLEWETPDFHPAAIAAAGGIAPWTRAVFATPEMWAARLQLAADSTAALRRVLGEAARKQRDRGKDSTVPQPTRDDSPAPPERLPAVTPAGSRRTPRHHMSRAPNSRRACSSTGIPRHTPRSGA